MCCSGSLFNFKILLKRNDISGKVKGAFKSHYDFFIRIGKSLLVEMALQYFGMEECNATPTQNYSISTESDQTEVNMFTFLESLLDAYHFCSFSIDSNLPNQANEISTDQLFNYCVNLSHWVLHLLHIEDTTKEGDMDRLVLNCKQNMLFFYTHSTRSKYFIANLDYILKVCFTLPEMMQIRVLEGSFVNINGGLGNNIEADLLQEHSVRNRKDLIRMLGSNKSEKAISRVTEAADSVCLTAEMFDQSLNIVPESNRHGRISCEADDNIIQSTFRNIRPFQIDNFRKFKGFERMCANPFDSINKSILCEDLCKNIDKMCKSKMQIIYDFDTV
jgi:hypothetical protein